MPFIRILTHLIWSTKDRRALITKDLKPILLNHIKDNSIKKGIFICNLNCTSDHIHLLISLGAEQNISNVIMMIKGESSYWVNKQKLTNFKFEWQDEYIALSVNYKSLNEVASYIMNQEEHHLTKTFSQEYDEFIKNHGIDKFGLKPV